LRRVADSHSSSLIYPQIERCLARHKAGLGIESIIEVAMQHAASHGEWDQVRSWSAQYDCIVEALVVAAEHGNVELIHSHFVEQAAKPTLESASRHGRLEVVSFLVGIGVREFGESVLWAVRSGHEQVVQFLVHSSADVGAIDELGRTALHWAVNSKCAQVLLDAGVR
jgi:hypothetical protein